MLTALIVKLLWLNPLLWPWLVFWEFLCLTALFLTTAAFSVKQTGVFAAHPKVLATDNSHPIFVFLATLLVLLGKLLVLLLRRGRGHDSQSTRMETRLASVDTDKWVTPPTSPPPFDAGSESDASLSDGQAVPAPTLRERLRKLRHTISVTASISWKLAPSFHMYDRGPSWGSRADRADMALGMNRSLRAYNLFEEIKQDYANAHASFPEESPERVEVMQQIHLRSAKKCLELARTNGGIYTKAAQFVASLQGGAGDKGIPKAYVDVLRVLTDAAPYRPFEEMDQVLIKEFGASGREVFAQIDETPIAAASLAQVHRATLKDGMVVAVKILYPSLRKELASDFEVFKRLGRQIKPGGYDMSWLVGNFEESIRTELDCEHEAINCEESSRLLAGRRGVKIPKIVWEYTRQDVLTMEYIPGMMQVTEPGVLTANGLALSDCASVVSDTLTELTLVHGHVHGDPHAGNIYIIGERGGLLNRAVRPACVVLDHGLYYSIDTAKREDLCRLYLACIARNSAEINRLAQRLAGPLHRFFPLLLSPWFVLGTSLSSEDIQAARANKLPPSVSAKDVGDAMTTLHTMGNSSGGNVITILHSFGYVRGLLNALSFGERRRLKSIARYSVLGLAPRHVCVEALEKGDTALPWYWRARLARAAVQVDLMAALLQVYAPPPSFPSPVLTGHTASLHPVLTGRSIDAQVYALAIVEEVDAEGSLGACVALAEATLAVGRAPFVQWLLRRPAKPLRDAEAAPPAVQPGGDTGGATAGSVASATPTTPHVPHPPPPRTKRTHRVPHPVLVGHAASLTPY